MSTPGFENEAAMWLPEHDYTPAQDRSVIRAVRSATGVASYRDFAVTATTPPSWNVTVGPGRAVIDGTVAPWLQGSYVVYSPESRELPVAPSHPTMDRFDLVVIRVLDQENDAQAEGYGWRREVLRGADVTPGTDPGPPDLTNYPNCLPLRGIKVAAGSGNVPANGFWPAVWPWGTGSDLRRPMGSSLMRMFDVKVNAGTGPAIGWIKPTYFDLQVPLPWREVGLWPFDVVMEHDVVAWVWSGTAGVVSFNYDPRTNPDAGTSPPGRVTGQIQLPANNTQTWALSDSQLFVPGESPQWALWWNSTVGTNVTVRDRTVIIPRTDTTNRVTDAGLVW